METRVSSSVLTSMYNKHFTRSLLSMMGLRKKKYLELPQFSSYWNGFYIKCGSISLVVVSTFSENCKSINKNLWTLAKTLLYSCVLQRARENGGVRGVTQAMIYQLIPRLCLRFVRAVCGARADKGYGEYYLVTLSRELCYLAANIFTLLLLVTYKTSDTMRTLSSDSLSYSH